MRFKEIKDLTTIELIAREFGATLTPIEYGTMQYMGLSDNEIRLIMNYELEKSKMLRQRWEHQEETRRIKRETRRGMEE